MELRQLEGFVAVATELHFSRAAEGLYLSPATLSDLVRRLETELGTPLFIRTTRRVSLTAAGAELLPRARAILDEIAAARAAVRGLADGQTGTVRVGITPPVSPVLAPYLVAQFAGHAPQVTVEVQRMWLPGLVDGLTEGTIDVAVTCGLSGTPEGIESRVIGSEPLLVGLRPEHRLASEPVIDLADLARDTLGLASEQLFPAWVLSQRQALDAAGVSPPVTELTDAALAPVGWMRQPEVDWVLLIASLAGAHTDTVVRPVSPDPLIPFSMMWNPGRTYAPAVQDFVAVTLAGDPPPGWVVTAPN